MPLPCATGRLESVGAGPKAAGVGWASLRSSAPISTSASLGKISRPAKVNVDASQGCGLVKTGKLASGKVVFDAMATIDVSGAAVIAPDGQALMHTWHCVQIA